MLTIKAHYDGKVLVPDEPVKDIPRGKPLIVNVEEAQEARKTKKQAGKRKLGLFEGKIWMSPDFDDPLPDSFWLGEE